MSFVAIIYVVHDAVVQEIDCGIAQKSTNIKWVIAHSPTFRADAAMADERAPLLPHDEELDQSLSGRLSAAMNSPATLNSLERFLALAAIGLLLVSLLTLGLLTGLATVHNDERSKPRSTVTKTRTQTRTHTVLGPTTTAFPKPRKNVSSCSKISRLQELNLVSRRISASLPPAYQPLLELSPPSTRLSIPARTFTDSRVGRIVLSFRFVADSSR